MNHLRRPAMEIPSPSAVLDQARIGEGELLPDQPRPPAAQAALTHNRSHKYNL
jgi:hypothetical protein